MDLQEAYAKCTHLAQSHYENFPVGRLVPAAIRPHVHAIYAFARVADDLADEGYVATDKHTPPSPEERTELLLQYEAQLTASLNGQFLDPKTEWIFLPLADTAKKFNIPSQLFYDLLSAFRQDVLKRRYATFSEVLDYCRRSANPVGRLVLHLHHRTDPVEYQLSDEICTGLQLANFWQDVSVDLLKDRIYIPEEDMQAFGFSEADLFKKEPTLAIRKCTEFQVNRTWKIFEKGRDLSKKLPRSLGFEIRLTWLGGTTILRKIARQKYDTLSRRPKINKWDIMRLLLYAWFVR